MRQIKEHIKKLRQYASERKGEIADICNRAADTIEGLSAKLCTSRYSDDAIQKMQDMEQAELEKAYKLGRMEHEYATSRKSRQVRKRGSMTREELKAHCERQIEICEIWAHGRGEKPSGKVYEEHKLILELLEQESCKETLKTGKWVFEGKWSDWFEATYKCSCCNRKIIVPFELRGKELHKEYPYCHCGAKMEDVEK